MKKVYPVTTHVSFILDKSGSMGAIVDATISGFNEYIQTLQNDKKGDYLFSLTMFDDRVYNQYVDKLIKDVKFLNGETYQPNNGTALYDAAMKTINELKREKDPILMVIMTDGQENSSQEYSHKDLKKAIKELKSKGNWTFVFLGANQDSWATAGLIGMDRGNVANFASSSVGMQNAMRSVADNTVRYAASMNLNKSKGINPTMDSFFGGIKDIDEK